MKRAILIIALLSFAGTLSHAADAEVLALGKKTYEAQCLRCHGADGKGNGVDAIRLYVPPRDFTSGRFKFKSTAQGTPPSDDDLIKGILGHGITGSGMPSFGNLEMTTKVALAEYIKTFSTAFNGVASQPIANPSNVGAAVDVKKGAELFEKLQCALCHGTHGRANGTSAFTLQDGWGHPLRPTNLTQGWTYGGGPKPMDVYHRIMAGIDGAPMPSYDGAVTKEEAWILSNYVASLQLNANWSDDINILKADALPTDAAAAVWDKAPRTDIVLDGYYVQGGKRIPFAVNAISVQAVGNADGVAFKLTWDDPIKSEKYPGDAVTMAIKPKDFSGNPRATLGTLYDSGAAVLDLTSWNAVTPDNIQIQVSNVAALANGSYRDTAKKPAVASYDDGRWTLVFSRPLEAGDLHMVAFSVASGDANETEIKRPSSRWMRLHFPQKSTHAH